VDVLQASHGLGVEKAPTLRESVEHDWEETSPEGDPSIGLGEFWIIEIRGGDQAQDEG